MRQVLISPGEDGYWVAECPSLPGCISQEKRGMRQFPILRKPSRDILRHWNKMDYQCLPSISTLCWWQYEQVAQNIGPRMR